MTNESQRPSEKWCEQKSGKGGGGGAERKVSFPFSPLHFLDLVPFLAWPKLKIPFLGLSLLRKQMEMLARR